MQAQNENHHGNLHLQHFAENILKRLENRPKPSPLGKDIFIDKMHCSMSPSPVTAPRRRRKAFPPHEAKLPCRFNGPVRQVAPPLDSEQRASVNVYPLVPIGTENRNVVDHHENTAYHLQAWRGVPQEKFWTN